MKSVLRSSRVQTQGLLELRAGERAASPHLVDVIDIAPGSKPSRWIGRTLNQQRRWTSVSKVTL